MSLDTHTPTLAELCRDLATARNRRKHAAAEARRTGRHGSYRHGQTAAAARAARNLACADAAVQLIEAAIATRTTAEHSRDIGSTRN